MGLYMRRLLASPPLGLAGLGVGSLSDVKARLRSADTSRAVTYIHVPAPRTHLNHTE